jgi:hypothetical protein
MSLERERALASLVPKLVSTQCQLPKHLLLEGAVEPFRVIHRNDERIPVPRLKTNITLILQMLTPSHRSYIPIYPYRPKTK